MDSRNNTYNMTQIISEYIDRIFSELKERWNTWEKDINRKEEFEVIGGILSRQVAIMTNYASSPNLWNGDMAPIILRALVDNYINLAWICKEPSGRAQKFILHGLGQEKLNIEHFKSRIKKDGGKPNEDSIVQSLEDWINSQRYSFITEVNLGSWSGINTRSMATEAGCIDLYNYAYQPLSSSAHSMWNHISKFNLERSENPLHKGFFKPVVHKFDSEFTFFEMGARYLEKSFQLFDHTFNITIKIRSSYERAIEGINDVLNEEE